MSGICALQFIESIIARSKIAFFLNYSAAAGALGVAAAGEGVAAGAAVIVTEVVVVYCEHPFAAATV